MGKRKEGKPEQWQENERNIGQEINKLIENGRLREKAIGDKLNKSTFIRLPRQPSWNRHICGAVCGLVRTRANLTRI